MRTETATAKIMISTIIAFIVLLWVSWVSALLKSFNAWLNLLIAAVITAAISPFLLRCAGHRGIPPGGKHGNAALLLAVLLILSISLLNFLLFHDSLSGYRDEGIYANDAVYLAHHGNLPFPELNGNDTRLFLNTVWNAELYGLFGYMGIRLSNAIPFAIALLCVFAMVSGLSRNRWAGLVSISLISFSYPFLWYSRRTNNEVFFFSLTWIAVYLVYRCLKDNEAIRSDFALYLLCIPLPAFVRPEGLFILALGTAGAIYVYLRGGWGKRIYPLPLFLVVILLLLLALWGGYELMTAKYGEGFIIKKATSGTTTTSQQSGSASKGHIDVPTLYENKPAYTMTVMIKFGLFPALLLILPFLGFLLFKRPTRPFGVFLILLSLPFFYFCINPGISFDLPWFTRRFVAVLIPLAFISFSVLVSFLKKPSATAIHAIYLALTLAISAPIVFHQDYRNAIRRMDEIVASIPDDVKILVDRYTLGDFTLSGPLFFVYDRDVAQITPWRPVSIDQVGEPGTAYLVTNADNWRKSFRNGLNVFDESVNLAEFEIVKELVVPVRYLLPTCEFQRSGNADTWTSIDYRIALSNIEVPSKKAFAEYRVVIVRMELYAASSVENLVGKP